jgi:hypothetical protein
MAFFDKIELLGVTSTQIVQASIRRYAAQNEFIKNVDRMILQDKMFSAFCELVKENKGSKNKLVVTMYSRQKGDKADRRLFIDDKTKCLLCWQVPLSVAK